MEAEHPIPQQISAYQFRLVGDMTIKQFFQVAAGALIALLIYSMAIPYYVKWPLVLISFLSGVAFAFFPLQDRPLATWILLFIKAIYSPTVYVWERGSDKYQYFRAEKDDAQVPPITPQETKVLEISKVDVSSPELKKLETAEQEFMVKLESHLNSAKPIAASFVQVKPIPTQAPQTQFIQGVAVPQKQQVAVPTSGTVQPTPLQPSQQTGIESFVSPVSAKAVGVQGSVIFAPEAAPPLPPNMPNVIVGQVLDNEGNIIASAILEIQDSGGRPVRALKSNKLGHFTIVTPLANGKYGILTEKEGFDFETLTFEAKGEIIPPILLRPKKLEVLNNIN